METKILEKIKFSLLIGVFFITVFISTLFKPSINYVNQQTLAKDVVGVGEIKSAKIIDEREKHGFYENEKDFDERTSSLGVGEVVAKRIKRTYRF